MTPFTASPSESQWLTPFPSQKPIQLDYFRIPDANDKAEVATSVSCVLGEGNSPASKKLSNHISGDRLLQGVESTGFLPEHKDSSASPMRATQYILH